MPSDLILSIYLHISFCFYSFAKFCLIYFNPSANSVNRSKHILNQESEQVCSTPKEPKRNKNKFCEQKISPSQKFPKRKVRRLLRVAISDLMTNEFVFKTQLNIGNNDFYFALFPSHFLRFRISYLVSLSTNFPVHQRLLFIS